VPTFYSDIEEVTKNDKGHLILTSGCLGSFLSTALLKEREDLAESFLTWCVDTICSGNVFVETQPVVYEEQIKANKRAVLLAKKMGLPCIVTNDIHYINKEDAKVHAAFLNSKDEEREVEQFYSGTYFKTEEEMIADMDYLPREEVEEMFANTCKILDMCERYSLKQNTIVPKRSIPEFQLRHLFKDWYGQYEYIEKFAHSEYEQDAFLLYQIENGFEEKYQKYSEENLARIDIELKQLWLISIRLEDRVSSYYNIVQEIIDIMWDDNKGNSLVGVARGSVTGYYVAYLISITQLNPITWNLPYWRHLVAERPEMPKQYWAYKVNVLVKRCIVDV